MESVHTFQVDPTYSLSPSPTLTSPTLISPTLISPSMSMIAKNHTEISSTPIAPNNFHRVVKNLYRSSFPQPEHLSYLTKLNIKVIITLVDTEYSTEYAEWMVKNNITSYRIPLTPNKPLKKMSMESEFVLNIICEHILNPAQYPILMHCNHGKHRTGCVIACFQKALLYINQPQSIIIGNYPKSIEEVLCEYNQHAYDIGTSSDKSRAADRNFIQNFDVRPIVSQLEQQGSNGTFVHLQGSFE